MSLSGFGYHHQTGSLPVETMNEAGANESCVAAFEIKMVRQAIEQRPVAVAMRRVDEHAGRFVDDDEMGVFVNDLKVDLLRLHCGAARHVDADLDEILRPHAVADVLESPVYL